MTSGVPRTNTLEALNEPACQGVDYYVFRVSPDAVQATFKLFDVYGDLDVYITHGVPLPSPTNWLKLIGFQGVVGPAAHPQRKHPKEKPPRAGGGFVIPGDKRGPAPGN